MQKHLLMLLCFIQLQQVTSTTKTKAGKTADLFFSSYTGTSPCAGDKPGLQQNGWTQLPGSDAADITVSETGVYYMVNNAGLIYKYNGSSWEKMPGSDGRAIAANAGKLWLVNTKGKMYQWNNSTNSWTRMPGSDGKDIAIDASGNIWMVNTSGYLYEYRNSTWYQMAAYDIARVSAGNSLVYLVNTAGKIYRYTLASGAAQDPGSDARDIAVTNDLKGFITNTAGKIYQYQVDRSDGPWLQLSGSDGRTIGANNGKVVLVNTAGKIYERIY